MQNPPALDTTDFITYAGPISTDGYEAICDALKTARSAKAMLVLFTAGGDPHAGFRIARALQHHYESFDALVPRYCKSAGTLVLIGAKRIFLDDMSELGPLDVQVKKSDELVGRNSGLDIFQAVNYLQGQAMTAFLSYLTELTQNGLSTKVASEISTRLTIGMLDPISAQLDPMKLAEMQRATEIAFAYGNRLNDKSKNLRAEGIAQLVSGYPSHGFVIDRKEAKTIFTDVRRPDGVLSQISEALRVQDFSQLSADTPQVRLHTMNFLVEGDESATTPNASASAEGGSGSEPKVDGPGEANAASPVSSADSRHAEKA